MPMLAGGVLLLVAVVLMVVAVWFGRSIIAPQIQRRIDRTDDNEEPGDRPD